MPREPALVIKKSLKRESWYLPLFGAQGDKDKLEGETGKKWPFFMKRTKKKGSEQSFHPRGDDPICQMIPTIQDNDVISMSMTTLCCTQPRGVTGSLATCSGGVVGKNLVRIRRRRCGSTE